MVRRRQSHGFTYLMVLFAVAFLGLGLMLAGETWRTAVQREREAQLLYVGNQYRKAIQRYYQSGPSQYPRSLADLLKDGRQAGVARYLRRLYPDPVTGSDRWGLVRTPAGEIMGVYSLSSAVPFKTLGFAEGNDFADAKTYADWKFVYQPR
ncbi:MAG TPA: type II secretion system protein [Burkholderiales bacterium]